MALLSHSGALFKLLINAHSYFEHSHAPLFFENNLTTNNMETSKRRVRNSDIYMEYWEMKRSRIKQVAERLGAKYNLHANHIRKIIREYNTQK